MIHLQGKTFVGFILKDPIKSKSSPTVSAEKLDPKQKKTGTNQEHPKEKNVTKEKVTTEDTKGEKINKQKNGVKSAK